MYGNCVYYSLPVGGALRLKMCFGYNLSDRTRELSKTDRHVHFVSL